jgi:hypothetical protein
VYIDRTMMGAFLVGVALAAGQAGQVPSAAELLPPVQLAREALQRASNGLARSANQSCDVWQARAAIKLASKDLDAAAAYADAHPESAKLLPMPPDVTPEFTPPPRPAPQRNVMLEGALRDVSIAFQQFSDVPGSDLGGLRDPVYHDLDAAARHLMTAIKAANAAFKAGQRDLPACTSMPPGNGGAR